MIFPSFVFIVRISLILGKLHDGPCRGKMIMSGFSKVEMSC